MVQSLTARRGLRRMRRGLVFGFGAVLLLGLGLGLFVPGSVWSSVVLGVASATAMFVISWYTTTAVLRADHVAVGWVAGDYVVKIILTLGVLLIAKNVPGFNVLVVAGLLIAGIAVTAVVQVTAFAPERRAPVPREVDDASE